MGSSWRSMDFTPRRKSIFRCTHPAAPGYTITTEVRSVFRVAIQDRWKLHVAHDLTHLHVAASMSTSEQLVRGVEQLLNIYKIGWLSRSRYANESSTPSSSVFIKNETNVFVGSGEPSLDIFQTGLTRHRRRSPDSIRSMTVVQYSISDNRTSQ